MGKNQPADTTPAQNGTDKKSAVSFWHRYPRWVYPTTAAIALASGGAVESQTGFVQARVFHGMAEGRIFSTIRTSSPTVAAPAEGPYDERLGYTRSLEFRERLTERGGYQVTGETRWIDRSIFGIDLYPIYNARSQAGLYITDDTNTVMYEATYPRRSFAEFDEIPPLLVHSLLFVENRELLGNHTTTWNPAVEWVRLGNAFMGYGLNVIGLPQDRAGGSTLATQTEKFRHSPDGVTGSPLDKFRQMLTASVRAYQNNGDTRQAREEIVLNYLNSMPLSAYPRFGEVSGFSDGMSLWFGADMQQTSRLLRTPDAQLNETELQQKAVAYRQALSIVMSVKKPSAYLLRNRAELDQRVNSYLPLLAEAGIISPAMRDRVLRTPLVFTDPATHERNNPLPAPKPVQGLRNELMRSLGETNVYNFNRLDLTARTTLDARANAAVTTRLRSLADPAVAAENGLIGYRMLQPEMTGSVVYSFSLYERQADGNNVLRVQTDSFNGQLNLNEGTKLELGSTAKLRTMVTYLQIISEIHGRLKDKTPEQLAATRQNDDLTRFVVAHLSAPDTDKSLNGTLEASLNRTYSASPGERFFTNGGVMTFNNFDSRENGRSFTVKEALQQSNNLAFVRIMRDVVRHVQAEQLNVDPAIFTDPNHPQRRAYLNRFAQDEGALFMWRAWVQQRDLPANQLASHLASKTRRGPTALAVIFRSLHPNASQEQMETFIRRECTSCTPNTDFGRLYNSYGRDKFNINDRGYLTGLHPMALWLAEQRVADRNLTWENALARSADERIQIYGWLINSNKYEAQNNRIHSIIEKEAFTRIHRYWRDQGFPFQQMIPSYASALGASGDTPAALATLAGIIQHDGIRRDSIRFREITLAPDTPYQLTYRRPPVSETRVLAPEVARLARREMQNVVELGTARRAFESVVLSDGRVLPVGGKTGTGDNRDEGTSGTSGVRNRTATFVFTIDDRFYGCITVFVDGPSAGNYRFTSSLASQVFKSLVPDFQPVLERAYRTPMPAPAPISVTPPPAANTNLTVTFNTPVTTPTPVPTPTTVPTPVAAPTTVAPAPTETVAPQPEPTTPAPTETPAPPPVVAPVPAPMQETPTTTTVVETPPEPTPEPPAPPADLPGPQAALVPANKRGMMG